MRRLDQHTVAGGRVSPDPLGGRCAVGHHLAAARLGHRTPVRAIDDTKRVEHLCRVLTDSAVGAAGATMFVAIVSQIIDGLSILHAVHPYLLSHDWLAFSDLFRSPVLWTGMIHGLVRAGVYTGLFLALALWRFRSRDVTS